jgi:hypothetical protein
MAKKTEQTKKTSPFKTAVQNLPFHNFEEIKTLVALFKETVTLGDDDDKEKPFVANVMVDLASGEEKYVQNSYSIAKAIKLAKEEYKEDISLVVFEIEFIGKTEIKGKPFNKFKIGYCTLTEYENFMNA